MIDRGGKKPMLANKQPRKFMPPLFLAALILVLGLAACSPTDMPETGVEGIPNDLPPQAVLEAANRLSEELGISVEEIEIVEFEQVEWPDACLGIPQEGQACAQVITPGFRVELEVNGQQYEFRSDETGTLIVQSPQE
jgi:hypothetical protein